MRRWWRGTFGLVAAVALGFALATLAIGVVAFESTHEALELQLDHRIAIETQALIDEGQDGYQGVAAAIRRREAASSTASLGYRLVDVANNPVAGSLDAIVPSKPGYVELLPYKAHGEDRIAQSLTTAIPGGYRLLVAADRAAIDEMDNRFILLFLGAFGAMLLLGIAAAWLVGLVTRRRLARIDQTAAAIIAGDLSRRVPLAGSGDEFDGVATTLNRMLDRIAGLMENLRQVSSDVAHDLRTPLTRLQNRLDEALRERDSELQREAIEAAASEAGELLEVFSALLRIAEVEGLAARAHFQTVDLSAVVADVVEAFRPAMESSGHQLVSRISPGLTLSGDRRLLQQMLTNLLDNAAQHTPQGTTVHVGLEAAASTIQLTVTDDGPGVEAHQAPKLFNRFARVERSRSTPGHGLGLAMVAAIVAAHSGRATIMPRPGFGVHIDL
ncbi:sensor histidine kinase [Blastomonas sp. SL216]|uniref:sensor histidine kinase n=1 Tax=Blastomonas sp. SL216 TaxID=2995169 RepID=UPI002377BF30|nr:ATP-binding protein [Blastomonas sp. SL216]